MKKMEDNCCQKNMVSEEYGRKEKNVGSRSSQSPAAASVYDLIE
jgi:hypothetical protein